MSEGFSIERAGFDEASFADVFALMVELHREGGYAPLDTDKAAANVFAALKEDMTFVARLPSGEAIGALVMVELTFWYHPNTFLQDMGFYVRPPYRLRAGAPGPFPGVALLRAARDESHARNTIAFITVNNPDRRPKQTAMSLESQTLGFVPLGYTIKL